MVRLGRLYCMNLTNMSLFMVASMQIQGGGLEVGVLSYLDFYHTQKKGLVKRVFNFGSMHQDLGTPIRLQNGAYVIKLATFKKDYDTNVKELREG